MEAYNLILINKEKEMLKIEDVQTGRVPVKGETIPFNLVGKGIFRIWYQEYEAYSLNKEIPEEKSGNLYNSFNGKRYEVEKVEHNLRQKGHPNCGRLETRLFVFANEKE